MIRILSVVFIFLLIYSIRLNYPSLPYFDETLVLPEARSLSHLSHYHGSSHPILGKAIIAFSIHFFGDNPWAWRLPSLVFASGATALCAYLAFILTENVTLFWLVSFLLATDGLWITEARIGLYNSATIFFIIATLVFWWKGRWKTAAICFGLALAIKWRAFPLILIPPIFYWFTEKNKQPWPLNLRLWIYGALIVLATYFSTFLIIPFIKGMHWADILNLQGQIVSHATRTYTLKHPYFSPWYSWPFLTRPIWFYFLRYPHGDIPLSDQTVEGIVCMGNPAIFMLIFPAMIGLVVDFWRKRSAVSIVALSGFLLFWLPSGLLRFTYFYQFYFALPFIAIAIAVMLDGMWRSGNKILGLLTVILLLLILAGYIYFFALWTGIPILDKFYRPHLWLHTWT